VRCFPPLVTISFVQLMYQLKLYSILSVIHSVSA